MPGRRPGPGNRLGFAVIGGTGVGFVGGRRAVRHRPSVASESSARSTSCPATSASSPNASSGHGHIDRNAVAAAATTVRVAQSEHALLASGAVQIRATWRIGWKPVRSDRIGKFTIGTAESV